MTVMLGKNHVGKIKDHTINPELAHTTGPSNTSAPTPTRAFEPHHDAWANHSEATRVANNQFGRAGRGPTADSSIDRGPFAARTKLTSNP